MFNVNNIQLEKKEKTRNSDLANQAIKKGFVKLIEKILLKEDVNKFSNLSFSEIKQLVTYYQISNFTDKNVEAELVNFSITFDKEKIHKLFFNEGISYSEISDKELFILPIFIKNNEIFVFNNNFFYENWNNIYQNDLIEFILPLENIEIIQNINKSRNNLIALNLDSLFQEYSNKNLALILIEFNKSINEKVYIKTKIQGKKISKNLTIKNQNLEDKKFFEKIVTEVKKEIVNLIKSENLIDIRTPSFLNVKFYLNKKNNLVELNSRIKDMELIDNIYVQEFNKDYMNLRFKYLGKLEKIINQLKNKNIILQLKNNEWIIRTL